ncbi:MAG: amidohydrolase family protein, partial [Desulfurococcales archaeon]|nr:amidohydrolase family protein [Desulfurococcales archaeon]
LGQGRVSDPHYPFGSGNMLEVAFLTSHVLWSMGGRELEEMVDMVTWRAAKALGAEYCGLRRGCRADFVVADGRTVHEVLWKHSPPKYVVRGGKVVSAWKADVRTYV